MCTLILKLSYVLKNHVIFYKYLYYTYKLLYKIMFCTYIIVLVFKINIIIVDNYTHLYLFVNK